jgi:hypothetical protein
MIEAMCNDCRHEARILVDALAGSVCGSKNVVTRPDRR